GVSEVLGDGAVEAAGFEGAEVCKRTLENVVHDAARRAIAGTGGSRQGAQVDDPEENARGPGEERRENGWAVSRHAAPRRLVGGIRRSSRRRRSRSDPGCTTSVDAPH